MRRTSGCGTALLLALFVVGCVKDGERPVTEAATDPGAPTYSIFFDQGDHVDELVAAGAHAQAAEVYGQHQAWFDERRFARYAPKLKLAAEAMNAGLVPGLRAAARRLAAIDDPIRPDSWAAAQGMLADAKARLAAYDAVLLLQHPEFRAPEAETLRAALAGTTAALATDAPLAFAAFDHFAGASFFERFPLALDRRSFLRDNLPTIDLRLQGATADQLASFARTYSPDGALDPSIVGALGARYVGARLRQGAQGAPPDLRAVFEALHAARAEGLEPNAVPGLRIGFVEVTSKTLLKQGQIDFPAEVEIDLPFESGKFDLDAALSNPVADQAQYLVLFDVALAKANRRVLDLQKVPSRILTGHQRMPNPEYETARLGVINAQNELYAARMQRAIAASRPAMTTVEGMGRLADVLGEYLARQKLDQYTELLRKTPPFVEVPVYQAYQFDHARMEATRTMTVHYYVIDRHANSYLKSTFDATERQQFTVAYNVHENDASRAEHLARAGTEKDVAAWEDQPMKVRLSWLLDDYVRNTDKMQRLPTLAALRDEMLRDKNTALARVEANTFKASTQGDPRFDSVVAVYTARGLGSGFYVAPDVVMTNYHVVESARYVEMKLHGGQETFGRTIATDPHRDLALVRVQARGQPVRFYARNTLDLGRTIDVIGHPRQLEFSITRGVISAVRKHKSVNIPGARELQVIQTDAAANPGNSGGPWFLGDEVIAVTSFGRSDRGSQNLNFGVHYAEAIAFMRENDIQPLTR